MSKNKLGQEPAFPSTDGRSFANEVMSKRFYAACAAMQGIISNRSFLLLITEKAEVTKMDWTENLIYHSYILADELLKQENL